MSVVSGILSSCSVQGKVTWPLTKCSLVFFLLRDYALPIPPIPKCAQINSPPPLEKLLDAVAWRLCHGM